MLPGGKIGASNPASSGVTEVTPEPASHPSELSMQQYLELKGIVHTWK
jgi:hypothetical protein